MMEVQQGFYLGKGADGLSMCSHRSGSDCLQDISLGKPAKAQLAKSVRGPEEAYQLMKGKQFVVETKFDGPPAVCHLTIKIVSDCASLPLMWSLGSSGASPLVLACKLLALGLRGAWSSMRASRPLAALRSSTCWQR